MRTFNYSAIKEQKWDSDVLGLIAAIYKEAGKQELYLKQRPEELEKLVEIAKIQSTEASNAIEGIVTTRTRIRQLVEEKTTPRNRDEQEIAGYLGRMGRLVPGAPGLRILYQRLIFEEGTALDGLVGQVLIQIGADAALSRVDLQPGKDG